MISNNENQIGSYHRSASWQISHLLKGMSGEQQKAFIAKMNEQEAINRVLGRPVNEQLLAITKERVNREVDKK